MGLELPRSPEQFLEHEMRMTEMKKLPNIQLNQLTPVSVGVSLLGFCLMQADALKDLGAIFFCLGLLPLALMLSKYKD